MVLVTAKFKKKGNSYKFTISINVKKKVVMNIKVENWSNVYVNRGFCNGLVDKLCCFRNSLSWVCSTMCVRKSCYCMIFFYSFALFLMHIPLILPIKFKFLCVT